MKLKSFLVICGVMAALSASADEVSVHCSGADLSDLTCGGEILEGIAMAAALAQLPTTVPKGRHAVGIAVGGYAGEAAGAVGYAGRIGESATITASVASTNNSETAGGVGMIFTW